MRQKSISTDEMQRVFVARRLTRIFDEYERTDIDASTNDGAWKHIDTLAAQQSALDTLFGRKPDSPVPPSNPQAAQFLKHLLRDVPNNLSPHEATEATMLIDCLCPSQSASTSQIR